MPSELSPELVERLKRYLKIADGKALVSVPPRAIREAIAALQGRAELVAALEEAIELRGDDDVAQHWRTLLAEHSGAGR